MRTLMSSTALALIVSASVAVAQDVSDPSGEDPNAPVVNQDVISEDGSTATEGDTSTETSSFDSLSPGGKSIAKALFDAQQQADDGTTDGGDGIADGGDGVADGGDGVADGGDDVANGGDGVADGGDSVAGGDSAATATTATAETQTDGPLTLNEIASLKQDGQGWGQVFKEMQAQGLVSEKNLGQVVSKSRRGLLVSPEPAGDDGATAGDGTDTDGTTTGDGVDTADGNATDGGDATTTQAATSPAESGAANAGRGASVKSQSRGGPKHSSVVVTFGDGGSTVAGPMVNRGKGNAREHGMAGKSVGARHGNGKSNAGKSNSPVTFGGTAASNGGAGPRGHASGGNGHGNGATSTIVTTGANTSNAASAGSGAAAQGGGNGKGHAYGRHK